MGELSTPELGLAVHLNCGWQVHLTMAFIAFFNGVLFMILQASRSALGNIGLGVTEG